eukprot:TRINITY_DN16461_c0_g1_i1.p4 TRINITY_DN16461_c0_g1~~TRINITY_DN16461_c0_g1_i1.p4  ORF type:complete len:107 (+),score=2.92 TRINITY_DN16461_c0_g1_i1:301-621(+)
MIYEMHAYILSQIQFTQQQHQYLVVITASLLSLILNYHYPEKEKKIGGKCRLQHEFLSFQQKSWRSKAKFKGRENKKNILFQLTTQLQLKLNNKSNKSSQIRLEIS